MTTNCRRPRRATGRALVIASLYLGVLAAVGCISGASVPGRHSAVEAGAIERLASTFDSLRIVAHIPGLSVAVIHEREVVMERAFGFAELDARIPATPATPYDIASVSKPISAVAALRLVELGRLDLDRPMDSYADFEEFCAHARGAGGIFFGDFACTRQPGAPALTLRHVLSMTMNGSPGERFLYNPPAFSWGSRPIAEAAGTPFSVLVDSLVFQPAGMMRSARRHRRLPLREDLAAALAVPYRMDSTATGVRYVRADPPPPQGDGAAGGVVSTVRDLAKFDIALDEGRLIGDSLRALMWEPARLTDGGTAPYGLGWFVQDVGGRRVVWHTGLWEGRYSALYLKIPSARVTLILLANSEGLQWPTPFDSADITGSAFARALLESSLGRSGH